MLLWAPLWLEKAPTNRAPQVSSSSCPASRRKWTRGDEQFSFFVFLAAPSSGSALLAGHILHPVTSHTFANNRPLKVALSVDDSSTSDRAERSKTPHSQVHTVSTALPHWMGLSSHNGRVLQQFCRLKRSSKLLHSPKQSSLLTA